MSQLHHPKTNSIPLLFIPTRKIQNIVLLEDSEGTWVLRIHLRLEAKHSSPLRLSYHIIQLYSQTSLAMSGNVYLHLSLCYKGKWKEQGRAIDFATWLIHLPLIYLVIDNLSLEVLRSWTWVIIMRKNDIHSTEVSASLVSFVSFRNSPSVWLLLLKTVFI